MFYQDSEWLTPEHDALQLRILTASPAQLKGLLKDCQPPIFSAVELIDAITIEGEVHVAFNQAADAILTFTAPSCQPRALSVRDLTDFTQQEHVDGKLSLHSQDGSYVFVVRATSGARVEYSLLEGFFARTQMLNAGQFFQSVGEIRACLEGLGYPPSLIASLLEQPMAYPDSTFDQAASWCETTATSGFGTVRRQVCIGRNGSVYALRYRDQVEPQCPVHFPHIQRRVLLEIKAGAGIQSFGGVLRQINRYRSRLGISKAILICEGLSAPEVQALRFQGVSVYPAENLLRVW